MPKISRSAKVRCFYCDEHSIERGTGVTKRKYKLAGIQTHDSFKKLGIPSYIYFVTTTQSHHNAQVTLKIEPHEMDHYVHKPLSHVPTYIDIRNRERIFEADLQAKINNATNGFRKVAQLSQQKWTELQGLAPMILSQRVGDDLKKEVLHGLLGQTSAEDLLQRWNLT